MAYIADLSKTRTKTANQLSDFAAPHFISERNRDPRDALESTKRTC